MNKKQRYNEKELYLRKGTLQDLDILYEWANDSDVRKNSFRTEKIKYEEHVEWFANAIKDKTIILYVMMWKDIAVGQIRFKVKNDNAEISYSIAKEYRGHGFGDCILRLAIEKIRKENPQIKRLIAKVKPDNMESNHLFQKEGFDLEYHCYTLSVSAITNE